MQDTGKYQKQKKAKLIFIKTRAGKTAHKINIMKTVLFCCLALYMLCSCTAPEITPEPEEIAQDTNPAWLQGAFISEFGEEQPDGSTTKKILSFTPEYGFLDLTFENSQGVPILPYQPIYYVVAQPYTAFGSHANFTVFHENNIDYVEFDFTDIFNPENPMHIKISKVITDNGALKINVQLTNAQGNYNFGMFNPYN